MVRADRDPETYDPTQWSKAMDRLLRALAFLKQAWHR
jgi:hypothetical protein